MWCGAAAGGGCSSSAFKVWCLFLRLRLSRCSQVTVSVYLHMGVCMADPTKADAAPVCTCRCCSYFCVCFLPCSVPHAVKGEAIYAYVTVLDEVQPSPKLHAELVNLVKTQIGSFAAPDVIHWAPGESASLPACVRAVALRFWFHAALPLLPGAVGSAVSSWFGCFLKQSRADGSVGRHLLHSKHCTGVSACRHPPTPPAPRNIPSHLCLLQLVVQVATAPCVCACCPPGACLLTCDLPSCRVFVGSV